jgi:hypothetical protein
MATDEMATDEMATDEMATDEMASDVLLAAAARVVTKMRSRLVALIGCSDAVDR